MSKKIQGFKPGDEIPSSATFLSSAIGRTGLLMFYYEVKESTVGGKKKHDIDFIKITESIISYLNEKTGRAFSPKSPDTRKYIKARLLDGMTEEKIKTAIDNKAAGWLDDPEWSVFLRPRTLFGPKCEGYANEVPAVQQEQNLFAELETYNVKAKDEH